MKSGATALHAPQVHLLFAYAKQAQLCAAENKDHVRFCRKLYDATECLESSSSFYSRKVPAAQIFRIVFAEIF